MGQRAGAAGEQGARGLARLRVWGRTRWASGDGLGTGLRTSRGMLEYRWSYCLLYESCPKFAGSWRSAGLAACSSAGSATSAATGLHAGAPPVHHSARGEGARDC